MSSFSVQVVIFSHSFSPWNVIGRHEWCFLSFEFEIACQGFSVCLENVAKLILCSFSVTGSCFDIDKNSRMRTCPHVLTRNVAECIYRHSNVQLVQWDGPKRLCLACSAPLNPVSQFAKFNLLTLVRVGEEDCPGEYTWQVFLNTALTEHWACLTMSLYPLLVEVQYPSIHISFRRGRSLKVHTVYYLGGFCEIWFWIM